MPSQAALDIFDRPKSVEAKKKMEKRQTEVSFLDYPNECILKGDYPRALEVSQKLLEEPASAKLKKEIAYLIGLSLLKLDRFLEARRYFNDVLLMEGVGGELRMKALLGIADSYVTEGRYDKAKEAYKRILSEYPDGQINCMVYYRLGEVCSRLGEGAEAKYYTDKVRIEFPFSFEARLTDTRLTLPCRQAGVGQAVGQARLIGEIKIQPAPPPAAAIAADDYYYVQVGCFSAKTNADRLCEKLISQGFDAYISESSDTEGAKFRVKIGRLHSEEEAQALGKKLKRAGYPTKVCP